jgi:beta-glucosidase
MTVPLSSSFHFPKEFTFGVATSAFQIEGAWDADGKGPSIWDTFGHTPGRVFDDIPGDVAVDHYHRSARDIQLMKEMGIQSYRFSLSWPRIFPDGVGRVNQKGLDFYRRLVDRLLDASIAPNVTLYHWDLPQALEDRGGWPHPDSPKWFEEYATTVFREFRGLVPIWSTLNEPISLWVGYGMGAFAPGRADEGPARQAMHNVMVAHGRAVRAFREQGHIDSQIGLALDIWQRHPATESLADRTIALRDEEDSFRFFLDALLTGAYRPSIVERLSLRGVMPVVKPGDLELTSLPVDFLGLNVYSRVVVSAENYNPNWWVPGTDHPGGNFLGNGMEFYPRSVFDAAKMLANDYGYRGPLYVTENGMADAPPDSTRDPLCDEERIRYLGGFLEWIGRALEEGIDFRGYYVWSLMDNYEWAAGFSQKFGLVHVDPHTLERTPKLSAGWYRDLIRRRTLV